MSQSLDIGTVLGNGRYVIEKVLGIGGFGITYYARHKELGSIYAIKELFISGNCIRAFDRKTVELQGLERASFEKWRSNFVDEAHVLAKLNNPHIVKVFDIFDENGTSYMVMGFVPGVTLQKWIEQNGKMPYDDAVNVMGQLSEAVAYFHKEHILHRDIKPDNIIITPNNGVVLIDFGSAREFVHNQTQRQTAILTKGYAPIEQYNAVSRKGNYTDIYAMGGVFYFLLTRVVPKDASLRAMESMSSPKELNPSIPARVSSTIMKAMAFKPEDRYQTVNDFMKDLFDVESPKPTGKPKLWWIALVVVGGLLLLGIAGRMWYSYIEEEREARMELEKQKRAIDAEKEAERRAKAEAESEQARKEAEKAQEEAEKAKAEVEKLKREQAKAGELAQKQAVPLQDTSKPKQEEPVEQPQTTVNNRALFRGHDNSQTGGSNSIKGQSGDQGNPKGLAGIKMYQGNGGKGNVTGFDLGGRGAKYLCPPDSNFSEEGIVVVDIWINRDGKVVRAEVATKGTNIVNKEMRQSAIQAAKRSTFASDPAAPKEHHGTITYSFVFLK